MQHAILLSVGVGDIITLLGAPFWMWHSDDLLEGSFVIPATTYHPGTELDNYEFPLFGLMKLSRLLLPGSLDPYKMD